MGWFFPPWNGMREHPHTPPTRTQNKLNTGGHDKGNDPSFLHPIFHRWICFPNFVLRHFCPYRSSLLWKARTKNPAKYISFSYNFQIMSFQNPKAVVQGMVKTCEYFTRAYLQHNIILSRYPDRNHFMWLSDVRWCTPTSIAEVVRVGLWSFSQQEANSREVNACCYFYGLFGKEDYIKLRVGE